MQHVRIYAIYPIFPDILKKIVLYKNVDGCISLEV